MSPRIWVSPPTTEDDIRIALIHMQPYDIDEDVAKLWETFYTPTAWLNPPKDVPFWATSFGAFTLNRLSGKVMLKRVQEGFGPKPEAFQKPHRLLPELELALTGHLSNLTDLDARALDLGRRLAEASQRIGKPKT